VLGQSNRVCEIFLRNILDWQLENILEAMQVPFPELTNLKLFKHEFRRGETLSCIPDSFLDGSAPRLRYFTLDGISFPGLPKLLSSATHLVELRLDDIPDSDYISPEAMVALISVLSSLRILSFGFHSRQSGPGPESRSLPPPKRSILPALRRLDFKGVTKYLEKLVTAIDTPQLEDMHITFFYQVNIDTPRLAQFINRTPALRARDNAHVQFRHWNTSASVVLLAQSSTLEIEILCELDRRLSSAAQVCNSSLHPLSLVEDLYIQHRYYLWPRDCKNDGIESTLWLQLLLPFIAVQNLYLSKEFASGIMAALQDLVGSRITEVLPSLQNIFVEGLRVETSGLFQENIGQFVALRQLSDHPIAISDWVKDSHMK